MKYSMGSLLTMVLLAVHSNASSIQGDITLNYKNAGKPFVKEFGDTLKAKTKWYAGKFFDKETVFAGVTVKNTGATPKHFEYYVAFFDKDKKLVATAGQGEGGIHGVKPGESMQLGSCLITLPKDKWKEITSYQVTFYEMDVEK